MGSRSWGAFLIVVLVLTILIPAVNAENESYIFQWAISPEGGILDCRGIAYDSAGSIYITTFGNIWKYRSDGTFLAKWGSYGGGDGQFDQPAGIAVNASGYVYVADSGNRRIQVFTSTGEYVTKWGSSGTDDGQFNAPGGIAVNASGYVYVTDVHNSRIQVFTSTGEYVTQWGSSGTDDGQFNRPTSIAINSSGYVYVVDFIDNRIQVFTSTGEYVTKWGSYGTGEGQFNWPEGIAVNASGTIYVTDGFNSRVQVFTSTGEYLTQWGTYGSGNGEFNSPQGIVADMDGNVYVAENGNWRVQKFTSNGTVITKWGFAGTGENVFAYPNSIAVDNHGDLYVADSGGDSPHRMDSASYIRKYTSNGTFLLKWSSDSRIGIAVDDDDDVYVADFNNSRIVKFDSIGGYLKEWSTGGYAPEDIAVDSNGYVYVTNPYDNNVVKFTSDGAYVTQWGGIYGSDAGQFLWGSPNSIAVDGYGNVYVTDIGNHRIQVFTSTGEYVTQWGSEGNDDGQFNFPRGISVDANGYVYVADSGNDRIQVFTSDGTFVKKWGTVGFDNGQVFGPMDIAVDGSGNIYIVDFGWAPRIQKFSPGIFDRVIVNFKANATYSNPPLTVQFTDTSINSPTSWNWSFGDGYYSTEQNPIHTYTMPGAFNVTLDVTGFGKTFNATKAHFITATRAGSLLLSNSTFFGGSGNQTGTGITVNGGAIYATGKQPNVRPMYFKSLVLKYAPDLVSTLWSRNISSYSTNFEGILALDDDVVAVGGNYDLTTDQVGEKEGKTFLARFSANGTDGSGAEGSLWATGGPGNLRPFFHLYDGGELFYSGTTASENNATVIYAAGVGEPLFYHCAYIITKYDASGHFINAVTDSSVVIDFDFDQGYLPGTFGSFGTGVAVLDGNIYVAGYSGWQLEGDAGGRPAIWKHDRNLNQIWRHKETNLTGHFNGIAASDDAIYAVGTKRKLGVYKTEDFLVQKYDETGSVIWSTISGGSDTDVLTGVAFNGNRLFAVGYTKSRGSGDTDAVLLEIDPATGYTLSTTYFGGVMDDKANDVATDGTNLYVVGESKSFASTDGNAVGQDDLMLLQYALQGNLPIVSFTAIPTSGNTPLIVQFNDTSTGSPTSWNWSFGDGNISTLQNPIHTYLHSGIFSISLNASNSGGFNSMLKTGYITVYPKGDFNGNWRVDIGDVTRVAYMAANLTSWNPAADFNGDTKVDIGDASKIAWYYVGKVAEL